jgi:hypothetical protein
LFSTDTIRAALQVELPSSIKFWNAWKVAVVRIGGDALPERADETQETSSGLSTTTLA